MTKCVFCGKEEHSFKGVHLIKNDGSVNYFCSSKCRKNLLKLGRDRRKLKWTEAYRLVIKKVRDKAKVKSDEKDKADKEKKEVVKTEIKQENKQEVKTESKADSKDKKVKSSKTASK